MDWQDEVSSTISTPSMTPLWKKCPLETTISSRPTNFWCKRDSPKTYSKKPTVKFENRKSEVNPKIYNGFLLKQLSVMYEKPPYSQSGLQFHAFSKEPSPIPTHSPIRKNPELLLFSSPFPIMKNSKKSSK